MSRHFITLLSPAVVASCTVLMAAPAAAVDGVVLITHAKALAGDVTPGDAPGYPVTLSLPGSYQLASNLAPGRNRDGIVAAAEDVTVDFNGFRMSGGPAGGSNNSRIGIVAQGDRLTVKNGTIGGFIDVGVDAFSRHYLIIENMRIMNNGAGVSNHNGKFTRIQNSTIATNSSNGILCGDSCQVEGSVVSSNGAAGITIFSGTVLGNTIISNVGFGLDAAALPTTYTGFGNNTIINNNNGNGQIAGNLIRLHPNACSPAC